jgi:hypothetical protein
MTEPLTPAERDLLLAIVDRSGTADPVSYHEVVPLLQFGLLSGGLVEVRNLVCRPTDAGRLVADLLRQVATLAWQNDDLLHEVEALTDSMRSTPMHPPGAYEPAEGEYVGWLGRDCPDGYEWRSRNNGGWSSQGDARKFFPGCLGMIRKASRLPVTITIDADTADYYDKNARGRGAAPSARVAEAVRAAREDKP